MKIAKRFVALIMSAVTVFCVASPLALAQGTETPPAINWDNFYIIEQPQGATVMGDEIYTLSVEVNIPEGVEVSYQWYYGPFYGKYYTAPMESDVREYVLDGSYPGSPVDEKKFYGPRYNDYYCVITAFVKDADGKIIRQKTLKSETARVITKKTFWQKVACVTVDPIYDAFAYSLATVMYSMGLGLPLAPFIFIGMSVLGIVMGFGAFFS